MNQHTEITQCIERYFAALYQGDNAELRELFHTTATLHGVVNGELYFKSVEQYLDMVANRISPKKRCEDFAMKIISIEMLHSIALVKAHCPMLGFNYIDCLSLLYLQGRWVIASKVFINV